MKKMLYICLFISTLSILQSFGFQKKPAKLLVFSKTMGFRHASIEQGKATIYKMGLAHQFEVDTTENAAVFTEDNLKKYSAVIFLSTTGDVLNNEQQIAFERYIQTGGGFVGIHAATDTEYEWPWYGKLVGAYFLSHPAQQEARFVIKEKNHPATRVFTDSIWMHKDELYNFKNINPDIKVLITIDEKSYKGGENGSDHPFSWYHSYDGGRAFYTSFGHTNECWLDEVFQKHLWGGIVYAIGNQKN